MAAFGLAMTPPGTLSPMDPFESDFLDRERWFVADEFFGRRVKSHGPARLGFQYLDAEENADRIADFLDLPEDGKVELARLHYRTGSGKDPGRRPTSRPPRPGSCPTARPAQGTRSSCPAAT